MKSSWEELGLPYCAANVAAGDIGASAAKKRGKETLGVWRKASVNGEAGVQVHGVWDTRLRSHKLGRVRWS